MQSSNLEPAASQPSGNFLRNERGGITYTPSMPIGRANARSSLLADVRVLADAVHDLCAAHRAFWPERYPVPEDVHCALLAADYGLARVRGGILKRLAEQDAAPATRVTSSAAHIGTADLIEIKQAAILLETCRQLLVDRPDEQKQLQHQAQTLREIVDRASERAWGMTLEIPGVKVKP